MEAIFGPPGNAIPNQDEPSFTFVPPTVAPQQVEVSQPENPPRRRRRTREEIAADNAATTSPSGLGQPLPATITETQQASPPTPRQIAEEEGDAPVSFTTPRVPTVGASLGATINMGNYESQKIDIWVTGIPIGASEEYIAEEMNKANITLHSVVDHLAQEMGRRMREDYGR